MKRPVIGIVPLVDIQRESYWMLPGYMVGVAEAGGLPFVLPLTDEEEQIDQLHRRAGRRTIHLWRGKGYRLRGVLSRAGRHGGEATARRIEA